MASALLLVWALEVFAFVDITFDAVTMATTHNRWTGDLAWLTDGQTPDNNPQAQAVEWVWIGLVAVSWPDTVRLERVRVYLGELRTYRLFGYVGGGFTEDGLRFGEELPAYGWEKAVPEGATGWYDIPCASKEPVDNISFQVIGGATIYEMQFFGPGVRLSNLPAMAPSKDPCKRDSRPIMRNKPVKIFARIIKGLIDFAVIAVAVVFIVIVIATNEGDSLLPAPIYFALIGLLVLPFVGIRALKKHLTAKGFSPGFQFFGSMCMAVLKLGILAMFFISKTI